MFSRLAGALSALLLSVPMYLALVFVLDQVHEITHDATPHYAAGAMVIAMLGFGIRFQRFWVELVKGVFVAPFRLVEMELRPYRRFFERFEKRKHVRERSRNP